jgi:hypothetical protein
VLQYRQPQPPQNRVWSVSFQSSLRPGFLVGLSWSWRSGFGMRNQFATYEVRRPE